MRFYSSVAQQSTLTASITPSTTTIQLSTTTGFPGSTPFTLSLDYGSAGEELVDVTAIAGLSLTVTRAVDGTSAQSHNAGAIVRHVSSGRDFAEMQQHIAATANVHGVTGAGNDLVGTLSTQTLSNKTLNRATGTLNRIDIFNTGVWRTTVIGDSTNTNQARLAILEDEISLRTMAVFNGNGSLTLIKASGDIDTTYRLRMTDVNGSTDRAAIFAGGTFSLTPTTTTTLVPLDVIAPDVSTAKRSIRVAAAGGGTERFTVWNDGRVDIVGNDTAFSLFDITAPAAHAAAYFRVMDSATNMLLTTASTGKTAANGTMDIRNDFGSGGTGAAVLRVFARNPGQTGDLTQWVDASNVIRCIVDSTGKLTSNGVLTSTLTATGATSLQSTSATSFGATSISSSGSITASGKVVAQNIRSGTAQSPAPGAGGGPSSVNVTFSSSMGTTPRVSIAPNTTVSPGTVNIQGYIDNVTATGFTINAFRSTNSVTNWDYIAITE